MIVRSYTQNPGVVTRNAHGDRVSPMSGPCEPCLVDSMVGDAQLAKSSTVATIPWQVWASVLSLSTIGAATGGYVATRSVKGSLVGGVGGLLGSGLALLLVGTINMYSSGGFQCAPKTPPVTTPEEATPPALHTELES